MGEHQIRLQTFCEGVSRICQRYNEKIDSKENYKGKELVAIDKKGEKGGSRNYMNTGECSTMEVVSSNEEISNIDPPISWVDWDSYSEQEF